MKLIAVILLGHVCATVLCDGSWTANCQAPCTCDQSYFNDLSVAKRWLNADSRQTIKVNDNQATYEETQNNGELLKTAVCVLQLDTNLQLLLNQLPKDLQVLTILQGRGSGEKSLEVEHLRDFQSLTVLDIQGYEQDDDNPTKTLTLRNDALRPLQTLQYLNLENIKLLGHPGEVRHANKIPDAVSEPVRQVRRKKERVPKQRLVFLKPDDNEIPLVSYKEYKEEIQRAGLATFAKLSKLLFLRVYSCNLREVDWEMFDGLDMLEYLSLERNSLMFVPDFAFYGTPHLKTLSLAGNQLLGLQDTALVGLLELEKLDLSGNNVSHLSELSLPPFPKLRVADFRYNPVEAVFPSTFEIMNATYELYLGGEDTPLNLLPNSFLGLTSLRQLSVTNIRVPILERELFAGMPKLTKLEMTGQVTSISFDAFLQISKLETLTLKKCNIATISMDAFYGLYGLISLDLSDNNLQTLPPGLFDQQFSLRELLLQNNKLTELPTNLLTHLPAKMIRLDHNPWHCSCAMKTWQPTTINKVKQWGRTSSRLCQFSYDKGSMCKTEEVQQYVYDKRVAPRCATPIKYKDWNVFHLLRKELPCNDKIKKNAKQYIQDKHEAYEKNLKPEHTLEKYRQLDQNLQGKDFAITIANKDINSTDSNPPKSLDKENTVPINPETIPTKFNGEIVSKKRKQQADILKEKSEKSEEKEKVKSGISSIEDPKIVKKAWKLENEKKRQEKLKQVHT